MFVWTVAEQFDRHQTRTFKHFLLLSRLNRASRRYSSSMDDYQKQDYGNIQQQPRTDLSCKPWEFEYPWSHGLCNFTEHCDETCYGIWCFPCHLT